MIGGPRAQWVLATGNPGKLAEFAALFAAEPVTLRALGEFTAARPAELGATFVENALIKARHAAGVSGLPALADDSGLVVEALEGAPGVRSARYAGTASDAGDNLAELLKRLSGVPEAGRGAQFHCVLVFLRFPGDPAPLLSHGTWTGRITTEPRGGAGFGYDPVFFDPELGATAAELSAEVKNRVSHRARAAATLRELIKLAG